MTDGYIESLLRRYFPKGVLVDTNILLLLFVGALSKEKIAKFDRTDQFTATDYELLVELLHSFKVIVTTPNILTEVNSLLNKLGKPAREVFSSGLTVLEETYLPSKEIVSLGWPFHEYGLTDCGIAEVAQGNYLVLTDDLKVTSYFSKRGIDTLNFNNLRYR